MAKKTKKVTLTQEAKQPNLKPYCEQAKVAAWYKSEAEKFRPLATEELQAKLDSDPETKDFTGTVVYLCDDQIYKIRVQRPDLTDWRTKRLQDPLLTEYKALMRELEQKNARSKELEVDLAKAHPRCVEKGFVIAYMSK